MNITGQLAEQQHEFSSPRTVYQLGMMRAHFCQFCDKCQGTALSVELLNLGVIECTRAEILRVGTVGGMTCTSAGDFISEHKLFTSEY